MTEPAPHRANGPEPLIQNLYMAAACAAQGVAAAPIADRLGLDAGPLPQEVVAAEAGRRLAQMLEGIDRWHTHPYRRSVPPPPCLWSEGATQLLDYGQCPEATAPNGPVVLVIPSMVNRAYVLDLETDSSFLRTLAANGLRPLLVDWGTPGQPEHDFSLNDYLSGRLRAMLAIARVLNAAPVPVIGYCMGGIFGTALAANAGTDVSALITIGTPWDFDKRLWVTDQLAKPFLPDAGRRLRDSIKTIGMALGVVPNLVFQSLFAQLDPTGTATKFRKLATMDPESEAARHFVAVEDWLNDGPGVAPQIAETVLVDWHLLNAIGHREWSAFGARVDPATITCPALCFCSASDRIAPLQSAQALPRAMRNAQLIQPSLGHVGMIVSHRSAAEVGAPLVAFLKSHGCAT